MENATSTGLSQKLSAVLYIQLMRVKESGVSVSVCMCVRVFANNCSTFMCLPTDEIENLLNRVYITPK